MSINGPLDSEQLTHREREVLRLARDGRTNNEIATELGISRNAVRYHLKELHSKFETGGVRSSLVARWRRALALPTFPAAKLGVPLTTALFAGGIALTGVAAMRYAPANLGSSTGDQATNACPTEFYAGTMTLSDFAFGNVTIEDLRPEPGHPRWPRCSRHRDSRAVRSFTRVWRGEHDASRINAEAGWNTLCVSRGPHGG